MLDIMIVFNNTIVLTEVGDLNTTSFFGKTTVYISWVQLSRLLIISDMINLQFERHYF